MLTKLEVFEKVRNHLLTQNRRCSTESEGCRLRDDCGNKCAVGCLIDDKFYRETLEHNSEIELGDTNVELQDALINSGVPFKECKYLLKDLQILHDTTPVPQWESELNLLKAKLVKTGEINE